MKKIELKDNLHWFVPSIITALVYVFWWKIIWSLFLIISCIYFIFHFWENLKFCLKIIVDFLSEKLKIRDTKKIIYWVIGLLIFLLIWVITLFWKSELEIYSIAEWYDIKYEDYFTSWNFDLDNWEIYEDKFMWTDFNSKSLNSSAYKERWYPLYIDLKNISWDKILVWKFKINWASRVWIRFANTDWYSSSELQELHFNECVLSSYEWWNVQKWYSHFIYKRNPTNNSSYTNFEITNDIYYVLAKIWWGKISCYFQKEWDDNYKEIIRNQNIVFENLGWPVMTKYIDDTNSYPELLEFKMYTKK